MDTTLHAKRPAARVEQVRWVPNPLQAGRLSMTTQSTEPRWIELEKINATSDEVTLFGQSLSHRSDPSRRDLIVCIAKRNRLRRSGPYPTIASVRPTLSFQH